MYKQILRRDKQNRINIPDDLLKLTDLIGVKKVAICSSEKGFYLRSIDNTRNCKIIAVINMDYKGRIIIPKKITEEKKMEVFSLNRELYIVPIIKASN